MIDKSDLIDIDFEGWPVYKMCLREILGQICYLEDGKYTIDYNDPLLDAYPIALEDDGMGYGVNKQYLTEFNVVDGSKITMFVDKPLPNIELWRASNISPYQSLEFKKDSPNYTEGLWIPVDIREKDGKYQYLLKKNMADSGNDNWVDESDLDYEY